MPGSVLNKRAISGGFRVRAAAVMTAAFVIASVAVGLAMAAVALGRFASLGEWFAVGASPVASVLALDVPPAADSPSRGPGGLASLLLLVGSAAASLLIGIGVWMGAAPGWAQQRLATAGLAVALGVSLLAALPAVGELGTAVPGWVAGVAGAGLLLDYANRGIRRPRRALPLGAPREIGHTTDE